MCLHWHVRPIHVVARMMILRPTWYAANYVISEWILLVLWCWKGVKETTTKVLGAVSTSIEFWNVIFCGFGQIVTAYVLHIGLIYNICLKSLLTMAFRSIVPNQHYLDVLLMWMMRIALPSWVSVSISTDLYLFNTTVTTHFWRLLVLETTATNRGSYTSGLVPNYLTSHVLIWTLVRVS